MRLGATAAVTISVNPPNNGYVDDESISFSMPPSPPPPPKGSSWDCFAPTDDSEDFRFIGHDGMNMNFEDLKAWKRVQGKEAGLEGIDEL